MSTLINNVETLQLITSKYIDENYPFYFPRELTHLCFKFFDYVSVLEIPQHYVNLIRQGDSTQISQLESISDEYFIHDIKFELTLNTTWIGLTAIKIPANIEYIRVFVNVYCKQTDYRYIQMHKFNKDIPFMNVKHYLFSIYPHECQTIQTMDLSYYIDVICIKYINKKDIIQIKPIKMKNKCKYKFKLDKLLIDKYKYHSTVNRYYSRAFDDTWYIASDYGICSIDNIGPILCLRLLILSLPKGIDSIKTKHSIKCLNNKHIKDKFHKRIFKYDKVHFCFYHHDDDDFYIPLFDANSPLLFEITIELVEVIDYNGNKVKRSDWSKYGII